MDQPQKNNPPFPVSSNGTQSQPDAQAIQRPSPTVGDQATAWQAARPVCDAHAAQTISGQATEGIFLKCLPSLPAKPVTTPSQRQHSHATMEPLPTVINPGNERMAVSESPGTESNAKPTMRTLSAKDFAVAFGRVHAANEGINQEVADAFAHAWAKDAQTLKYDGAYHQEGDFSTVTGDQGDISGWFPVQPSQETDDASFSVQRASSHAYQEAENQLFEAYGASYIEAYSVALSLEFHEAKPIPDDNTGDVTGPANSILYTPSGEPILLGTLARETPSDDSAEVGSASGISRDAAQPALTNGSKIVRAILLTIGAASFGLSVLYFLGLLL